MAELARDEIEELQQQLEAQGEGLKFLLLPKDPLDEKNIMLEVGGWGADGRAGGWVGGLLPHCWWRCFRRCSSCYRCCCCG
jgi:peptide chain release factor 1